MFEAPAHCARRHDQLSADLVETQRGSLAVSPWGPRRPEIEAISERNLFKNSSCYSSDVALNIKDETTDRLARELAALTGQPITTAVREAIRTQLEAIRRRRRLTDDADLYGIIARGRARSIVDDRSEDEILGYDQHGLPV